MHYARFPILSSKGIASQRTQCTVGNTANLRNIKAESMQYNEETYPQYTDPTRYYAVQEEAENKEDSNQQYYHYYYYTQQQQKQQQQEQQQKQQQQESYQEEEQLEEHLLHQTSLNDKLPTNMTQNNALGNGEEHLLENSVNQIANKSGSHNYYEAGKTTGPSQRRHPSQLQITRTITTMIRPSESCNNSCTSSSDEMSSQIKNASQKVLTPSSHNTHPSLPSTLRESETIESNNYNNHKEMNSITLTSNNEINMSCHYDTDRQLLLESCSKYASASSAAAAAGAKAVTRVPTTALTSESELLSHVDDYRTNAMYGECPHYYYEEYNNNNNNNNNSNHTSLSANKNVTETHATGEFEVVEEEFEPLAISATEDAPSSLRWNSSALHSSNVHEHVAAHSSAMHTLENKSKPLINSISAWIPPMCSDSVQQFGKNAFGHDAVTNLNNNNTCNTSLYYPEEHPIISTLKLQPSYGEPVYGPSVKPCRAQFIDLVRKEAAFTPFELTRNKELLARAQHDRQIACNNKNNNYNTSSNNNNIKELTSKQIQAHLDDNDLCNNAKQKEGEWCNVVEETKYDTLNSVTYSTKTHNNLSDPTEVMSIETSGKHTNAVNHTIDKVTFDVTPSAPRHNTHIEFTNSTSISDNNNNNNNKYCAENTDKENKEVEISPSPRRCLEKTPHHQLTTKVFAAPWHKSQNEYYTTSSLCTAMTVTPSQMGMTVSTRCNNSCSPSIIAARDGVAGPVYYEDAQLSMMMDGNEHLHTCGRPITHSLALTNISADTTLIASETEENNNNNNNSVTNHKTMETEEKATHKECDEHINNYEDKVISSNQGNESNNDHEEKKSEAVATTIKATTLEESLNENNSYNNQNNNYPHSNNKITANCINVTTQMSQSPAKNIAAAMQNLMRQINQQRKSPAQSDYVLKRTSDQANSIETKPIIPNKECQVLTKVQTMNNVQQEQRQCPSLHKCLMESFVENICEANDNRECTTKNLERYSMNDTTQSMTNKSNWSCAADAILSQSSEKALLSHTQEAANNDNNNNGDESNNNDKTTETRLEEHVCELSYDDYRKEEQEEEEQEEQQEQEQEQQPVHYSSRRASYYYNTDNISNNNNNNLNGLPEYVIVIEGHFHQRAAVFSHISWNVSNYVIFDSDRGIDLGQVVCCMSRLSSEYRQMMSLTPSKAPSLSSPLCLSCFVPVINNLMSSATRRRGNTPMILRTATREEQHNWLHHQKEAAVHTIPTAQAAVRELRLPLTIVAAVYQFNMKKLTFFYESSVNVDFRQLVRTLFSKFHCRIWMERADGEVEDHE